MEYNKAIQQWVYYDNKIKEYNEQIKPLRDNKKILEEKIIQFTSNNNLNDHIIKISDGTITFKQQSNQTPLSIKFIEKCLNDIIPSQQSVEKIINYITSQRDTNKKLNIKRLFNLEK